jgi:hypothetical protein
MECEISAFEEAGAEIQVFGGFAPLMMVPIGHMFTRDLYMQKEGGGINSFFAKVFLNSLHGKFQENPHKEQWTRDRPKKWIGPEPERMGQYWRSFNITVDKENRAAWNTHPIAAGQILARARVALWRVFRHVENHGGRVFYCDTDSIHTDLPPEKMGILGSHIGDLALETGPTEAIYLGPKSYLLHKNKKPIKAALKGFPFNGLINATKHGNAFKISDDEGGDHRYTVFDLALKNPITVERSSLSTFISGINTNWGVTDLIRTLSPTGRGKRIGADCFEYLTPKEMGQNKEPVKERSEVDFWDQDSFSFV